MKRLVNTLSFIITSAIAVCLLVSCVIAENNIAEQRNCLALNIYHESRSEPVMGQIAVANVTLNRVADSRWPSTVCEVVYQRKQFSWTHTIKDHTPYETERWAIAQDIAEGVYKGIDPDNTDGAVYYHADYVNPIWNRNLTRTVKIGVHIFYKG